MSSDSEDFDWEDFVPIIDCDRFSEAFGGSTETPIQLKCLRLGDGPCLCFTLPKVNSWDEMSLRAILERDIEDNGNSFASDDNIHDIGNCQLPETDSDETNPSISLSRDTNSSTIEKGIPINNEEVISICSEDTDSNTAAEHKSTATQSIPGIGSFQIEETRSDGFQCGMYALEISTNKQLAGSKLTPAAFQDIFSGPDMRAFNKERGYQNRNDFHDDQLACVLQIWGRREGHDKLQLGVVLEGGSCYILGAEERVICVETEAIMKTELQLGFTTIWIHNNNIMQSQGAAINHYSGISLLDTNEEQHSARRKDADERKERVETQEAVWERLEARAKQRPLEDPGEGEEPQRKKRKFRHGN